MNKFRTTIAISAATIASLGLGAASASATEMCIQEGADGFPEEVPCLPDLPKLPEYEFDFGGGWQPGDGLPGGTTPEEEPAEEPADADPGVLDLGDYELIPVPGYEFPWLGGGSGSGDADAPAEEPVAEEPAADEPSSDPEDIIPEGIEPEAIEPAEDAPADAAPATSEEPAAAATTADTPAVDESDSHSSDDDVIVLSGSTNGETITVQETITGTFTPAEDAGTVAAPVNNGSVSQSATEAQSANEVPQLRVVDGTEVFADLALDTPAADDADEPGDDDANSAGGRGIGTLIAALGLLVLGGGGATAAGVKVLRNRD